MAQNRPSIQELPPNAKLTQYGELGHFRDRLRPDIGETEISMILGEVDSIAASVLVTKIIQPDADRRVTTVGLLRQARFRVEHSPTRGNPLHVSVYPPNDETGEPAEWADELARQFSACFTEGKSEGRRRWRMSFRR